MRPGATANVALALCTVALLSNSGPPVIAGGPNTESQQKERLEQLGRFFGGVAGHRPEVLMRERWGRLLARFEALRAAQRQHAVQYEPHFRRDVTSLESELRSLREDLMKEARARAWHALGTLPARIARLRAAAEEGALPGLEPAEFERLANSAQASLDRARQFWGEEQMVDAALAGDAAREILDGVAVQDPCEPEWGNAVAAADRGQSEWARTLLTSLAARSCLDAAIPDRAAALLARLGPPPAPSPALATPAAPAQAAAAPGTRPAPVARPTADGGQRKQPATAPGLSPARPRLILDVWQSAWGDFAELETLFPYLGANRIRALNFNPGLGVTPTTLERGRERLRSLVGRLRAGGIDDIRYLYAETSNPISAHVELLVTTPDLGIDTLIDDSEFTDRQRPRFEANLATVRSAGLRYGAFVTVEQRGNSGVSDETRHWALREADFPTLMSYFSCTLAGQQAALEPFLRHADEAGRHEAVLVAILMGGKSVGRERSCERELSAEALALLLKELDEWARRFRSYGGLVLETNLRMPRHPVAPAPD